MNPREPEKIGQIFKDKNGNIYEGKMYLDQVDLEAIGCLRTTIYHFKEGKLHGTPAIEYPDGLEEDWDNGNFIKISLLPWNERK